MLREASNQFHVLTEFMHDGRHQKEGVDADRRELKCAAILASAGEVGGQQADLLRRQFQFRPAGLRAICDKHQRPTQHHPVAQRARQRLQQGDLGRAPLQRPARDLDLLDATRLARLYQLAISRQQGGKDGPIGTAPSQGMRAACQHRLDRLIDVFESSQRRAGMGTQQLFQPLIDADQRGCGNRSRRSETLQRIKDLGCINEGVRLDQREQQSGACRTASRDMSQKISSRQRRQTVGNRQQFAGWGSGGQRREQGRDLRGGAIEREGEFAVQSSRRIEQVVARAAQDFVGRDIVAPRHLECIEHPL